MSPSWCLSLKCGWLSSLLGHLLLTLWYASCLYSLPRMGCPDLRPQMTGYDSSLMGSLNVMPSYESYFTLSTATYSLNTGISYVGGVFGALFAGTVSDLRGRRQAMLLATAITFVGGVLQAASVHISMFIIARFILGVGLAVAATACPTYVAECARPSYRSFAMGLYYSCWGIGTLIASGVCYGVSTTVDGGIVREY